MLKAIAIDDERPALEIIEAFAGQTDEIELLKTFTRTREARQYLMEHSVDVLFLDIQMPAISGLEFIKTISQNPITIFTTSYSEYAVESYDLNAVDFLLKPFTFERFLQSLDKAQLLFQARQIDSKVPPLMLKVNYGVVPVQIHEILFIESLDNYVKIHRKDEKPLVVRMTLKEIYEKLPESQFLRAHRSFIVALEKIEFVRNKTIHIAGQEISLGGKYEQLFFDAFKGG
ncbi:MAG: response regulator transcription factor [Bacteroidetes bacterium]|nr:response regulator transcription factor [Bacteroidota bacterium]